MNMSPPNVMVVVCSLALAAIVMLFMTIALATDHWEQIEYNSEALKNLAVGNSSVLNTTNGYFEVTVLNTQTTADGRNTSGTPSPYTTLKFRARNGGIWRICDRLSDDYRQSLSEKQKNENQCFTYITDYRGVKHKLEHKGIWLVRMQNSAASCYIVTLLCLFTSIITGIIGLVLKQVSACMVTGVMYIVAGTFSCFGLVIMHTKLSFMRTGCYSLENLTEEICDCRIVSVGWSIPLAWVGFTFCLFTFVSWLFLARCIRLEKAKTII